MRIVEITIYLILNKTSLMRIRGQPLKNTESLDALSLEHSGFNYFLPLERAECGIKCQKSYRHGFKTAPLREIRRQLAQMKRH
jgi:hypothetical protein